MCRRLGKEAGLFSLLVLCHITLVYSQQQVTGSVVASLCNKASNCIECMEAHELCNWCIAKPSNSSKGWSQSNARCNTYENLMVKGCGAGAIMNITTEVLSKTETPVRDASDDGSTPAIQVSPQQVSVKLRPNEKFRIPLTFRLAQDYPVDLYYLMDLSQSMGDDKEKVANLGISLAEEMRKITKDVKLGFGSFVDKVLMPYVNTLEDRLKSPCSGCESPYSFKHRLSLTTSTNEFGIKVNATNISGNLDEPEGGFDALMQAIVCQDEIGWRNNSRKMLIFSTDASFHSAGDGKLGGVLEPNDGKCHMMNGEYTFADKQDYPSISQLASKVADNRMNVIFAVTTGQTSRYQSLSNIIPGSVTGELEDDSSNIVQLVRENYKKISSTVEMNIKADVDRIDTMSIKIRSSCNGAEFADGAMCDGLSPGSSVEFEVEVQATCDGREGVYEETFQVYPVGLGESMVVKVQVDCSCDCGDTEPNSGACSGSGTYDCGICKCAPSHYGDTCQCDKSNIGVNIDDSTALCTPPSNSSLTQLPCSGRGECLCGKCEQCECLPGSSGDGCTRFTGKYCQCNPSNCPKNLRGVCSGPDQGVCECDEETAVYSCQCLPGFTGSECECPTSNASCIDASGKLCSDIGTCVCGQCQCDAINNERYFGKYCEECSSCTSKCPDYEECVYCKASEEMGWFQDEYDETYCNAQCRNASVAQFVMTDELTEIDVRQCFDTRESDDCTVYYRYKFVPRSGYMVYIKNELDCPIKPNYLAIILGVVGGIVFIGVVALLIWKLVTTVHDRREFLRFEKERQQARWNQTENPIYVQATSTFKNPMYRGSMKENKPLMDSK